MGSLALAAVVALILLAAPATATAETASGCAADSLEHVSTRPDITDRTLLFDEFIRPLNQAALVRRSAALRTDAEYERRVDAGLNLDRINVALLGYGEEHDQTYEDMGVSVTILSLSLDTWDMASISLSRDIRVPEVEDQSARVPPRWPGTMRNAYRLLGADGMRTVLERATGLAIDFQVVMKDVFLRDYLADVSGPVELNVPRDVQTNVYRLDGVQHGEDFIPAGVQTLSPERAMTFVLGESQDPRGKADERSYRKNLLLKALSCQVRQRFAARDAGFALNLVRFAVGELRAQKLTTDFDFQVVLGGLRELAQAFVLARGNVDTTFPQLTSAREVVVHDEGFGDGGVRRVHHMITSPDDHGVPDHPLVKDELQIGSLAPYMLVPVGGNPYADDLIADYWGAVRSLVRATLTHPMRAQ